MRWSTRRQVLACAQKLFQDGQRIKVCQEWCVSQTFLTGQSLQGQPPLECSVCSHELPMCVRGPMRVGVCGHVCARARA